jgi:hypothetical protein
VNGTPSPPNAQFGPTLAEDLSRLLDLGTLLGVTFSLLVLAACVLALEQLARVLERRGWDRPGRLRGALPTLKVVAWLVGLVLVAMIPDDATVRGLAVGFVALAAVLSGRDVLRNLTASAALIAVRAVRTGQYLEVGPYRGQVIGMSLRGVEIETLEGTRVYVPGVMLHTRATILAGRRTGCGPVRVRLPVPGSFSEWSDETLRGMLRRVALVSPRRVPGTPVVVELDPAARAATLTLTPFDAREEQGLRVELERRLQGASQEAPPVRRRALTTTF